MIAPGLDALFVGINPGFASARARHHFANPANPFWRLLHDGGLVGRRLTPAEERVLLDHGLGITNLVARATSGVADLTRDDLECGRQALVRKIRRYRPRAVVFVGLTAYAAFGRRRRPRTTARSPVARRRIRCGEQPDRFAGARVFVVPNPSGRNAHFTRPEMRAAFRRVARALGRVRSAARGAGKEESMPPRSRRPGGRRWSAEVMRTSDALDLEEGVFARTPRELAASLKRSAERSRRRKGTAYQSAMSMLTFYGNRAGRNLSAAQKRKLQQAKEELRTLFGREPGKRRSARSVRRARRRPSG